MFDDIIIHNLVYIRFIYLSNVPEYNIIYQLDITIIQDLHIEAMEWKAGIKYMISKIVDA